MASLYPPRKSSASWQTTKYHDVGEMLSKLEDTLLRSATGNRLVRTTLFAHLRADGRALRYLRRVSRVLHDLVDAEPQRMFNTIYLHYPLRDRVLDTLPMAATHCDHLVINIGYPNESLERQVAALRLSDDSNASSKGRTGRSFSLPGLDIWHKRQSREKPDTDERRSSKDESLFRKTMKRLSNGEKRRSNDSDTSSIEKRISAPPSPTSPHGMLDKELRDHWLMLLAHFPQITALTISSNGDPACPGTTDIEKFLANLRSAIERSEFPQLRALFLTPMHVYGIMHFRFDAFGAYVEPLPYGTAVWHGLSTLEIQLKNPFSTGKLTENQKVGVKQQLHQYVRSFAPTLRCLRFMWLSADAPNPLLLDLEPGMEHQQAIHWRCLEELWLGNCSGLWTLTQSKHERCPALSRFKTLRNTGRSYKGGFEDNGSWIDVLLGQERSASSIYSQSVGDGSHMGVSRTSREVPFMLDL